MTISFKRVVKIVFFQAKFTAQVVFVYAGGCHIVFPLFNDVGGLNVLFVFVSMIVTGISLKTLAFLCILIHAMTDLLSSDSGPAPCCSCGLEGGNLEYSVTIIYSGSTLYVKTCRMTHTTFIQKT